MAAVDATSMGCAEDGLHEQASDGDLNWQEAYHRLLPLMRVNNHTSILYIVREYVVLGLTLSGCSWTYHEWSRGRLASSGFIALATISVFVIAALQHRLSGLAHDASHYSLFHNKLANELVSDWLLMFPIMGMTQRFRNSHLGHHLYVNHPDRDPDVQRLNAHAPQRFPVSRIGFCLRYLILALWLPALWSYLFGQAKGANGKVSGGVCDIPAPYRFRIGRMMRGCYWLSVLTIVYAWNAWPIFLMFWVLPLLTVYPLLIQVREIAHHSNAPGAGRFTNSRVFLVHPILRASIFSYGQDYHLTHHLFMMLPHHKMVQAHALLMRYKPYREQVVICRGFFYTTIGTKGPTVLDVLSRNPRPGELLWDGPPRQRVETT